jgi:Ca-activated chloride channel family protein
MLARFVRSVVATVGSTEEKPVKRIIPTTCVLFFWIVLSGFGHAQTVRPSAVDPNQATSGDLFWLSDSGAVPLPMTDIEVDLRVSGVVIDGKLTQQFENPTGETIEALYVFPLPPDAVVYAMEIRIGERRIVAEVREKEQARRIYTEAKEDGRKAALVAQYRPNLFRTSAANILPGESIEVELRFVQKAMRTGGEYRARFPLTIMPRYTPAGQEGIPVSNIQRHPTARVRVEIDDGSRLERIKTPFHSMRRSTDGNGRVLLEPSHGTVLADRDFILNWKPARSAMPEISTFVETRGDERYALIQLLPPAVDSSLGAGLPTETLFVIDVSSSMQGPSIDQARQALLRALARLRPEDRFNILRFNGDSVAYAAGFEAASAPALERARQWVAELEATGGTAIYPALARAMDMIGQGSNGYASRVIFLTDGAVANEQEVLRAIAGRLGQTRLHTIGIGAAPNAYLMRKMAWHGRGICEFVATVEQADNRIETFFDRLERPVWTDLELRWDGVRVEGIAPGRLPDLHLDEPLVLSAKLSATSGGTLTVGGWSIDGWTERTVALDQTSVENHGIALTWARAQVETLLDSLLEGADERTVRASVIDLGLAFHLVTAYTSLVAVEHYVGELSDGLEPALRHTLPRTGTLGPLKKRIALLFAVVGILGLYALRRNG